MIKTMLIAGALLGTTATGRAASYTFIPPGETTPEPYALTAPAETTEGESHPLIVFLHGRGGTHEHQWLKPDLDTFRKRVAERGYFALSPHLGVGNWMNARARRVLNALLDRVLKNHPIDPERVFIMGMSMGGGGALTFTAHHGDRMRAVCDIFGVTDFTQFYNSGSYHQSLQQAFGGTPETARDVYRAQSAMAQIDAFAGIPVFVLHGDRDGVVPTAHSRQFVAAMADRGHEVVYREVKGGKHASSLIQGYEDEILDFFDAADSRD